MQDLKEPDKTISAPGWGRQLETCTLSPEARGQVHRHVLVPFLKAVVLANVVQVVPADHNGALHLHLGDHA